MNRHLKCTLVLIFGLPALFIGTLVMIAAMLISIPFLPLQIAGCIEEIPLGYVTDFLFEALDKEKTMLPSLAPLLPIVAGAIAGASPRTAPSATRMAAARSARWSRRSIRTSTTLRSTTPRCSV